MLSNKNSDLMEEKKRRPSKDDIQIPSPSSLAMNQVAMRGRDRSFSFSGGEMPPVRERSHTISLTPKEFEEERKKSKAKLMSLGKKRKENEKRDPVNGSSIIIPDTLLASQCYARETQSAQEGLELLMENGVEIIKAGSLGKIVEWMLKKNEGKEFICFEPILLCHSLTGGAGGVWQILSQLRC